MSQLPLTTTFTAPSSCTTDIYASANHYFIGAPNPSACFPSGWARTSQYFSPGICPQSYTIACSSIVPVSGTGEGVETRGVCCPMNYACYTSTLRFPGQSCISTITSDITATVLSLPPPADGATATATHTAIIATLSANNEAVGAYGVSIRSQASDFSSTLSVTTSRSSSTSYLQQTLTTPQVSPPSSIVPIAEKNSGSGGLSMGAKAGIGVSIGAVGLMLLVLVAMFVRRRAGVGHQYIMNQRARRHEAQEGDEKGEDS